MGWQGLEHWTKLPPIYIVLYDSTTRAMDSQKLEIWDNWRMNAYSKCTFDGYDTKQNLFPNIFPLRTKRR
jgi:hypothetical protein